MGNPVDGLLHDPDQGVDSGELPPGDAVRAAAGDDADMAAARPFDRGKAGQPVRDHGAARKQMPLGPAGHPGLAEALGHVQVRRNGVALLAGRDRRSLVCSNRVPLAGEV